MAFKPKNKVELGEHLRTLLAEKLDAETDALTPEAEFIKDLGADSLDSVEIVMAMEEAFNVEIPDEDAAGLTSVGKLEDYLAEKLEL